MKPNWTGNRIGSKPMQVQHPVAAAKAYKFNLYFGSVYLSVSPRVPETPSILDAADWTSWHNQNHMAARQTG